MTKQKHVFILVGLTLALLSPWLWVQESRAAKSPAPIDLESHVRAFARAFDDNNLDLVMSYFAPNALYRTIEGDSITGLSEIRKAFDPQFNGAYGKMIFEVTQVVTDEVRRRVTLVWTCHHDFSPKANGLKNEFTRHLYKLLSGSKAYWYGLDVFELNADGKILSKSSYTTSKLPRMF